MSQIEYSQTLGQQEHIEYLLSKEAFIDWMNKNGGVVTMSQIGTFKNIREYYLKEHGLPLTSEIKGL